MFTSWKNLAVAVTVSLLVSGSAFAKGPTGGGNSGGSRGSFGSGNQTRSGNTGIVANNSVKSLPLNLSNNVNRNISNNLNRNINHNVNNILHNNKGNTGINIISNKPHNILTNNQHSNSNPIHNVLNKHNVHQNGVSQHNFKPCVIKTTWPKCDPCCHHKHWCDPVWLGWTCGYDYSCCRVVRCETLVVSCGGDLVLVGEGLNVPAAAVRIELNGMILEGSIIGQEPNKMVIRMPSVILEQPMLANVSLVLPNGEALVPITVTVFPTR